MHFLVDVVQKPQKPPT